MWEPSVSTVARSDLLARIGRGGRFRRRHRLGAAQHRSRLRRGRRTYGAIGLEGGALRLGRSCATGQPKPVHLADHCVSRQPRAKLLGDLARAEAVEPELLQHLDPFFGPPHLRLRDPGHVDPTSCVCRRALQPGDTRYRNPVSADHNGWEWFFPQKLDVDSSATHLLGAFGPVAPGRGAPHIPPMNIQTPAAQISRAIAPQRPRDLSRGELGGPAHPLTGGRCCASGRSACRRCCRRSSSHCST